MRVSSTVTRGPVITSLRTPVLASLAGIAAGYVVCLIAAVTLGMAVPDAGLVWNVVSPFRVAGWLCLAAHGTPLAVQSTAGLRAPDAIGSIGSLNEILGTHGDVAFSFTMFLVPLTVLAVVGITVALLIRRARPSSTREVLLWSATASLTHGVALALLAVVTSYRFVFTGRLAPDLGLGAATGRLVVGFGAGVLAAAAFGCLWGAVAAAAGGLSSLEMRSTIDIRTRVLLRGWMRGLGSSVGVIAALMALGAIGAAVTGHAPPLSLVAIGGLMLSANAVAAALLLVHGLSLSVALDAGPFTGWERADLLHVGVGGHAAPAAAWLAVVIPITAGVVAGRFCRRRLDLRAEQIAVRFGGLWGLTLAALALLLRVRVLSTFSVGSLDLGGGGVGFDPLFALVVGFLWGTVTSYVGARFARVHPDVHHLRESLATVASEPPLEAWTCPKCEMPNADTDRFCISCGTLKPG